MASFKARIGWKSPGKKENKYCQSVPTRRGIENAKKKQKIKKIKKYHYGIISSQNRLDKAKKGRK